jgi:small-conductance mechanosensitive channel
MIASAQTLNTIPTTASAIWPLVLSGAVNVIIAVVILGAGLLISRWTYRFIHNGLERARFVDPTLKPLLSNVARYSVIAITVIAVLQQFGVQTTSLIAVLGATGLALGLALQGTLSNVAAGVMLLALRPFRAGDNVVFGDTSGTVREVGLFRTILISANGEFISVPNVLIFAGTIVNQSSEGTRRVEFKVLIDSAADIGRAQQVGLAALHADERVLKSPVPAVVIDKLSETAVQLSIQAWTMTRSYTAAMSDLQKNVRAAIVGAGIAPPHQSISYIAAASRDTPDAPDGNEIRSPRTN